MNSSAKNQKINNMGTAPHTSKTASVMLKETETKFVSVKEFRRVISQLERIYHQDRSACVTEDERRTNKQIMQKVRNELLLIDCKRSNDDDKHDHHAILERTGKFLGLFSKNENAFEQIQADLGLCIDDNYSEYKAIIALAIAIGAGVSDKEYVHIVNEQTAILARNYNT